MAKKPKRLPQPAPSKPLFDWFEKEKSNRGKLREAGFSDGQITNWNKRGIPRAQLEQVVGIMGIGTEEYLVRAGELAPSARQPSPEYRSISEEAIQIAIAFDQLQPQSRDYIREQVFIYTVIDKSMPWLRHGKPIGRSYADFEKWHQENTTAKTLGEFAKHKEPDK